jgi:hypothetical protein
MKVESLSGRGQAGETPGAGAADKIGALGFMHTAVIADKEG